jgi:hypothetical protein
MSDSPPKPWRLPVFVSTSIWKKVVVNMAFIVQFGSKFPGHSPSTRCLSCAGLTGSRQVCGVPLGSPRAQWPGFTLAR